MASLAQNKNFLEFVNSTCTPISESIVSFVGVNSDNSVLISLHQINSGLINLNPTSNICPIDSYVIRVFPNTVSDDRILLLSSNNGSSSSFKLSEVSPNTNNLVEVPSSAIIFNPIDDKSNYTTNFEFPSSILVDDTTFSDSYIIQSRDDFSRAGYTSQLPVLLNDCSVCGCTAPGYSCQSTGFCQPNTDVCPEDALCGQLNGQCKGRCISANGIKTVCQKLPDGYACVPNANASSGTILIIIIIVSIIFIIFVGLLLAIWYKNRNPSHDFYIS